MGRKDLQVEETVDLNYLDCLHQETKGQMGEVRQRKSFQHRVRSRRAARARNQGRVVLGHQASDEEEKGVPGSKRAHSWGR